MAEVSKEVERLAGIIANEAYDVHRFTGASSVRVATTAVTMANNGKAMLNEPVKRAISLQDSSIKFRYACARHLVKIVRITEKDFRAKFPKFAPNKGPKKRVTKRITNPVR